MKCCVYCVYKKTCVNKEKENDIDLNCIFFNRVTLNEKVIGNEPVEATPENTII